jgi:hypothetical protein
MFGRLLIIIVSSVLSSIGLAHETRWGSKVHDYLFDLAFAKESESCRYYMKKGSRDVDAFQHQFSLSLSYQHAMRAPNQSISEARRKMIQFIENEYADAREAEEEGRLADSCFARGRALHPVGDSTSPVHEGFQVWDPYFKPWQIAQHGDTPTSKENLKALLNDPDRLMKTKFLLIKVDAAGMSGKKIIW